MLKRASLSMLVFSFARISIHAQAPVGTISGTVADATGAVVPSATVSITNKTNSVTRTLATNAAGLYSAPALSPGR